MGATAMCKWHVPLCVIPHEETLISSLSSSGTYLLSSQFMERHFGMSSFLTKMVLAGILELGGFDIMVMDGMIPAGTRIQGK